MDRIQPGYEFTDEGPRPRTDPEAQRLRHAAPTYTYEWLSTRFPITVEVAEGESAWHPGSTKRLLWGPLTVRYVRHEGGIDGTIL